MGAIDNFYSSMKRARGFARVARYEVVLHPPAGLVLPGGPSYSNDVNIFCDSIMMPGHDLNTSAVKFGTEVETQMVTSHKYEGTIDATFYLDHNLDLKEYFDAWQEQAVSTDRNAVSYYKTNEGAHNYVGSMEIYQLTSMPTTITTITAREDTSGGSGDHRTSKYKHGMEQESYDTHEPIRTYGIRAEEVFPETIAGIEYAYATVDEIAKLTVSFQYRKWKEIEPE
tara:strand:+ start:63 stop:740 length:678 start_codon:yes stop_codon:yes gene_type:complete